MGALDQIVDGIKEVLKMSAEIKRFSEAVRDLNVEVREIDRRLVRIETMAELSQLASAAKRLPPEG
jgi:hypothetical protein